MTLPPDVKPDPFLRAYARLVAKAVAEAQARAVEVDRLGGEVDRLNGEVNRLNTLLRTSSRPDAATHLRGIALMRGDIRRIRSDASQLSELENKHWDDASRDAANAASLRLQADQLFSEKARAAASNAQDLRATADHLQAEADRLTLGSMC